MSLRSICKRLRKSRRGQAVVEMAAVMPVLIMIILGSVDLFNIAVSYVQMNFIMSSFLNAFSTGQEIAPQVASFRKNTNINVVKMASERVARGREYDTNGFPLFFFFQPENFTVTPIRGGSSPNVGTIRCVEGKLTIGLTAGRMITGKPTTEIKKKVCAIMERKTT